LIVGTGGGVSADVYPDKAKMMIAAVAKYGQYPLEKSCYQKAEDFRRSYYNDLDDKLAKVKPLQHTMEDSADPMIKVCDNVMAGDTVRIKDSVKDALAAGHSSESIIQEGLGKGLSEIAEKHNKEQVFLPELVLASEVFNSGIEALESVLNEQSVKGRVVLGTIKGDVQEIGVNVDPEVFIQEAEAFSADIIAVGVYVRLAWPHAERLIALLREKNTPYKTLTGGKGYKNEKEALELGFDAYAESGLIAIEKANMLMAAENKE
jgi:5-methyltetrahydrofolate--homocysteine methyltransferase